VSCLKKKLLLVVLLLPLLFYPKDSPGQLFKEKVLPSHSPLEALISLDVKEMDIQNVLRLIAEKGNLNIIFEEEIQGKITLSLKQVRLKEALEAVLEIKRLVFREKDGIIRILKLEEKEEALPTPETRIISLQYIPAEEARELLEHLLSSSGVMKVDKRTNALIITDLPDNIQRIDQIAKNWMLRFLYRPNQKRRYLNYNT